MTETTAAQQDVPTTSQKVRARLAEALNLDLIGPWAGYELAEERLPGWVRPSNWYLTGFLVPSGAWPEHYTEADSDEDLDETPESGGLAEESSEELLRYLRDGRKALLCVSLFLAPLLQYGLVLFGAAVIGAAVVAPRVSGQERWSAYPGRIGGWLKRRLDLVAPCGFFLAGSTVSYLVTVRHQWGQPDFATDAYLSPYYYQGKFDAHSIFEVFEFSIDRIWSLLTYHLPDVVAIVALAAFAILLVAAFLGKFRGKPHDGAIAVLFSFCIAVSVGAAVLGMYPLGGTRQVIYLGPIVFLAVGLAFHWTAGRLSSLTRRGWTRPVLLVAMAGATVLAGVGAMRQDSPYQTRENIDPVLAENIESVLAVLKERVREEDMVYAGWGAVPAMRFYQGNEERPANYHYGNSGWCWRSPNSCLLEMADLAYWSGIVDGRIWFVGPWLPYMSGLSVEQVVFGPHDVYLIEDTAALITATLLMR